MTLTPRALKEPVCCRFSALSAMRPPSISSIAGRLRVGVRITSAAMAAWAAAISSPLISLPLATALSLPTPLALGLKNSDTAAAAASASGASWTARTRRLPTITPSAVGADRGDLLRSGDAEADRDRDRRLALRGLDQFGQLGR